jgi:lipooligosaccharide transport system ATP-binding protein
MSHGKAVAVGAPRELIREHAGTEAVEVYGSPARLTEVEAIARSRGWRTRRTGTSVSILHANGAADLDGERRVTNLEDVFVLLTGEEIS